MGVAQQGVGFAHLMRLGARCGGLDLSDQRKQREVNLSRKLGLTGAEEGQDGQYAPVHIVGLREG